MDRVDDMSQDIVKFNTYSRNLTKQQQQKHQVPVVYTHMHTAHPQTQTSTADTISAAYISGTERKTLTFTDWDSCTEAPIATQQENNRNIYFNPLQR